MSPYEQVLEKIQNSQNILVIGHENPDPDAIGAGGALLYYVEEKFPSKNILLANVNAFPQDLFFLGVQKFSSALANIDLNKFDLIIVVDCGELRRTGIADKLNDIKGKVFTISIDHHDSNKNFADLNIVEIVSSSSEIIYRLLKTGNVLLNKKISTCLLTGLTYDTAYFTNSGTTKEALAIASELMKTAADIRAIVRHTLKNKTRDTLRLWGEVLNQLHYNSKYQVAVAVIPKSTQIDPELFNDLKNYYLQYLQEAKFIIILRESDDGLIHCSLRTTRDNVNVAKLAERFGGGGHVKSAGFSFPGTLEKTASGWRIK
ncbi:MAG: Phosphoesterase RecJ domain protein [Parcubacteria group bacterium GW2011_GWC2_39_14]|nr:MAG: Phosphoesterase RecJ domain protein [Parcubacteria group bacterium GW2011_GWC2_39_14]KKR54131.1 MAG: Phosphoesterase RecJ domain protein [Parcubacteria group bacterium GW2011_GWA2_40_23]